MFKYLLHQKLSIILRPFILRLMHCIMYYSGCLPQNILASGNKISFVRLISLRNRLLCFSKQKSPVVVYSRYPWTTGSSSEPQKRCEFQVLALFENPVWFQPGSDSFMTLLRWYLLFMYHYGILWVSFSLENHKSCSLETRRKGQKPSTTQKDDRTCTDVLIHLYSN